MLQRWHDMGRPRGCPRAAPCPLLLLLSLRVLCSAGLGELGPTINGRALAVCTLREEESRVFTCRTARPVPGTALVWYLNGQKHEANCSATGAASTLTLTARRADRELSCSLTDPVSGKTYNASVLLDVQCKVHSTGPALAGGTGRACVAVPDQSRTMTYAPRSRSAAASHQSCANMADKPEILRADAHYQVDGTGILLVLFALVQANPPASVTWVDQDGQVMGNTSELLLLGAIHYPGLSNHSLRIHLSSAAGNFSLSAANSVGVATASLLPPGLLDARVKLPLLGVVVGAALALGTLLSLGSCAAYLACCRPKPVPGKGQAGGSSPLSQCSHSSEHVQPWGTRLPRQTQSLPPNLHLVDLTQEARASPKDVRASASTEESTLPGLEHSLVLSKLGEGTWAGFVQLPTSGRVYKMPSMSSEEIWL